MFASKWVIDPAHSEIHFKIKHLAISTVTGVFKIFEGTLETNHDYFENANIHLIIDAYSIDTNNIDRDEHLKSAAFFNADRFPKVEFQSTGFIKVEGDQYKLMGELTLKGIKKVIVLDVQFGGQAKDGFGVSKAGFEISGEIDRKEFGLEYNDLTQTGGMIVGEDVKIQANIQFVKQE